MDDEHRQLKSLLTRAVDLAGPFEPPPVEHLTRSRRHRTRLRALTAVAAAAAAVIAVAVGLSAAGPQHNGGHTTPSAGSTPSTDALPGPTGPKVSVSALKKYQWTALPPAPIAARGQVASAWTGRLLIVWSGGTSDGRLRSDGASYDPATRTWTKLPVSPLTARASASSVWVDGALVVWGGTGAGGRHATDGARYDPRTSRWTMLPAAPITSYSWAQLVVAGKTAVLLSAAGSDPGIVRADAYEPTTNTWQAMPDLRTAPSHKVLDGAALGVGNTVFLWSDWFHTTSPTKNSTIINSGVDTYALDARTAMWSPVPLKPDRGHSVQQPIWTGTEFLLPGEDIYCGPCSHPGGVPRPAVAIDPRTGERTPVPSGPLSIGITGYYWTGSALLGMDRSTKVSGSTHDNMSPGDLEAWDAHSNTWTTLASAKISGDGYAAATVWTGTRLLVWGITSTSGKAQPAGLQFAPAS